MITKDDERIEAIKLRKQGLSYNEILNNVRVSKSTLSLWLRDIGLAKQQRQKLTEKKLLAAHRGGEKKHIKRLLLTQKIQEAAINEVKFLSKRDLWLIGTILYWAEGTKEKEWAVGVGACFSNSDPLMIKLFLKWLADVCKIDKNRIQFSIFIHENNKYRLEKVKEFWSGATGFEITDFDTVYYKKHNPKTKRRNIGNNYYGVLKINVRASSVLNRMIAGWIKGVNKFYWGVV